MMTWADAHRIAIVASARAHRDYGLDTSQRIPVFDVIEAQDIMLNFRDGSRSCRAHTSQNQGPSSGSS